MFNSIDRIRQQAQAAITAAAQEATDRSTDASQEEVRVYETVEEANTSSQSTQRDLRNVSERLEQNQGESSTYDLGDRNSQHQPPGTIQKEEREE